ncbi:Uncharacterised protein [Mycobacterium tuberculosis]|nr:Uncharacterised protein [Mycobacterium tuberculosis]
MTNSPVVRSMTAREPLIAPGCFMYASSRAFSTRVKSSSMTRERCFANARSAPRSIVLISSTLFSLSQLARRRDA